MIALGLLLGLVLYVSLAIFLAWFLPRHFDPGRAKVIATTVILLGFALIPTWDIIPGRLYFNHLCETEGGVRVFRTVEGVEGFYYFPGAEIRREVLEHYGYKFIEVGANGSFFRYFKASNNLAKKKIGELKSEFGVKHNRETLFWNIKKYAEQIVRLDGGEVLATKIQYEYEGSWIQKKAIPLLGGGRFCPSLPPTSPAVERFYLATLVPDKQGMR